MLTAHYLLVALLSLPGAGAAAQTLDAYNPDKEGLYRFIVTPKNGRLIFPLDSGQQSVADGDIRSTLSRKKKELTCDFPINV
ncbi:MULTISPECIES: hypothetical protein [Klebsiella]|uniref:DUF4124 domain-containing protein n=1 Tax=Klebsiella indica TaxID=2582917 RepID=A0A5R9LG69_9ENTR|nr:hypothetical protein FE839_15225 [Klebsiella indica]